jgi:hypothetical protein
MMLIFNAFRYPGLLLSEELALYAGGVQWDHSPWKI